MMRSWQVPRRRPLGGDHRRFARAVLEGAIALCLLAAVAHAGAEPSTTLDLLSRLPEARTEASSNGARVAPLAPGDSIDITARPAGAARVRFAVEPARHAAEVELWWRTDAREWTKVAHTMRAELREASLEESGAAAIEIRFENPSKAPLRLTRAYIETQEGGQPPQLAASVRPATRPINILFYVIDTARRDRFSLYGYPSPTTPRLEGLAKKSLVFQRAYAPGPSTTPSISALFASRHPSDLGGRLTSREIVPETFAEVFQSAGYDTLALQANYMVREDFGYGRGFDHYRVFVDHQEGKRRTVGAEVLTEAALAWLREPVRRKKPFFLYIQSMDAHDYRPPEAQASQFEGTGFQGPWITEELRASTPSDSPLRAALDRYDATLAYADAQIGELLQQLETLGLAKNTAVVITSDHGEPLGQRGHLMHGRTLNEELVHIPLLIHLPWVPSPRDVPGVVSLIDLPPTLADLAGLDVPGHFVGHSLLQGYPGDRRPSAMGTRGGGRWRKQRELPHAFYLREDDWKLVLDEAGTRLYDIGADALEERDVSGEHPVTTLYLRSEIMRRSPAFREGWSEPSLLGEEMTEREREEFEAQLRSLGYIE